MSHSNNETDPRALPLADWRWAQGHLPIACLDILPLQILSGRLEAIGLIMRESPEGAGWSLAGGRIYRNESTEEAARRQLAADLGDEVRFRERPWETPDLLCQYFTEQRAGFPFDTRQHSVALTYLVELDGTIAPRDQALDYRWFAPDELPADSEMSFGQGVFLERLIGIARTRLTALHND